MIKPHILKTEKEWLDMRGTVVTATETSSLFSLNPYQSAKKMWARKLVPDFQENAFTITGKILEPAVIKAINLLTNRNFKGFEEDEHIPFFKHPYHKLGATPDAIMNDVLLECKTTSPKKFVDWEVQPPYYYIMQTHVQMLCTGLDKCVLACISTNMTPEYFNADFPIHIYFIEKHEEMHKLILDTVDRFWDDVDNFKVDREDARKVKEWLLNSMTKVQI